jgi:hypothetical protein
VLGSNVVLACHHHPLIHRPQPVQRCFSLGDLHFRRREAVAPRQLPKPAREKGLAITVFATHSFEQATPGADGVEFVRQCPFDLLQPSGQEV